MNNDKTATGVQPFEGGATVLFGVNPRDVALRGLNIADSNIIIGDCRTLGDGDVSFVDRKGGAVKRAVCTLFAANHEPHHDAVSVIEALVAVGFDGEIVVLAPQLLRPKMVETELRHLARGLKLRLIAGVLPPLTEI